MSAQPQGPASSLTSEDKLSLRDDSNVTVVASVIDLPRGIGFL